MCSFLLENGRNQKEKNEGLGIREDGESKVEGIVMG